MSRRHVVTFLTAPARSGKSFNEVRRICDEILAQETGVVYTNLPLHIDAIMEWASKKYGWESDAIRERLHVIDREVELQWMRAGQNIVDPVTGQKIGKHPITGPWEYFADKPLAGATIIIDEIHNFCGNTGTLNAIAQLWQQWLGELGHNQAVFRCLSQAPEKVHKCIKQEAQANYTIRNTGLDRDPYFKIELYDWLELWAGVFGQPYRIFVFEQEVMKVEGRRKKGERKLHLMGPPYFDFYDSFNKPIAYEQTDNVGSFQHEYEKHLKKGAIRGRLSLLWWFVRKNMYALFSRAAKMGLLVGGCAFLMFGGAGYLTSGMFSALNKATSGKEKIEKIENEKFVPRETKKEKSNDADAKVESVRKAYEDRLKKISEEREAAISEVERLQKQIASMGAVVLMTPDAIVLKKGQKYEVGQEINFGEYKGRTLKRIEYKRREAHLDDGSVLRLSD